MGDHFLTKTYLLVVLLAFLVLAVMTYAVAEQAYLTTTPKAANQTQQHINTIRQTITPQSIFLNNFLVSVPAIIPVAGPIIFGRVWINTGQTIGQLAYSYGVPPLTYVIGVYVPVGTIESMAYSVIITESLFLTFALAKGTIKERLKNQTWKSLILYIALLAIAAVVEAELIGLH
jgi:small-conductance mechanosensitive channel